MNNGRAYDTNGSEGVWFSSGKFGLDKRQSTIQLIVFDNEVPSVRPSKIFLGEGKHIEAAE